MRKVGTFVTVGNATNDFRRLWKIIGPSFELMPKPVVVQHGFTSTPPWLDVHAFDFCNRDDFNEYMRGAQLVISHAGAGTALACNALGKNLVIVPRMRAFGEHVDDHQVELAERLQEIGIAYYCNTAEELGAVLSRTLCAPPRLRVGRPDLVTGGSHLLVVAAIGGHLSEALAFLGSEDERRKSTFVTCAKRAPENHIHLNYFPESTSAVLFPLRIMQAAYFIARRRGITTVFTTGAGTGAAFAIAGVLLGKRVIAVDTITRIHAPSRWFSLLLNVPGIELYVYSWATWRLPRHVKAIQVDVEPGR